MEREGGEGEETVCGRKGRMRRSKKRCLAKSRDRVKGRGENGWTREQEEMQKKAGTEGGRRKEKEGGKKSATDRDIWHSLVSMGCPSIQKSFNCAVPLVTLTGHLTIQLPLLL